MKYESFKRKLAQCVPYILIEGCEWEDGMIGLAQVLSNTGYSYLSDETVEAIVDLMRKEVLDIIPSFDEYNEGWRNEVKGIRERAWKKAEERAALHPTWHMTLSGHYNEVLIDAIANGNGRW